MKQTRILNRLDNGLSQVGDERLYFFGITSILAGVIGSRWAVEAGNCGSEAPISASGGFGFGSVGGVGNERCVVVGVW
jgi:hypothetical protein